MAGVNPDYTNARSADGPTVYAWLIARIPLRSRLLKDDSLSKIARSWRQPCNGSKERLVAVEILDRWLTPVGIHLSELPDECWRWTPPRIVRRDECEAVCSEWLDGTPARVLARRYGVDRATVAAWVDDLRYLRDLTRMDEPKGQQADGHGEPVPHPDRAGRNGRPAEPPAPPTISSQAPVADLEGVAA